jgi:hypothetical protein
MCHSTTAIGVVCWLRQMHRPTSVRGISAATSDSTTRHTTNSNIAATSQPVSQTRRSLARNQYVAMPHVPVHLSDPAQHNIPTAPAFCGGRWGWWVAKAGAHSLPQIDHSSWLGSSFIARNSLRWGSIRLSSRARFGRRADPSTPQQRRAHAGL